MYSVFNYLLLVIWVYFSDIFEEKKKAPNGAMVIILNNPDFLSD
ncbi:hypothetical protein PROVRUST_08403 [Providencia rustigianii DSM 4541]|uniref:Uncharacterized protein n=1 Tax=Providencia rustigianii DSM 4541 TaxID=500637 RepID=D1P822_9GAMM|nr:hypothetical protein PROVRUST_08403 [Providencia rustigianii DSM 4541]